MAMKVATTAEEVQVEAEEAYCGGAREARKNLKPEPKKGQKAQRAARWHAKCFLPAAGTAPGSSAAPPATHSAGAAGAGAEDGDPNHWQPQGPLKVQPAT